MQANAARAVRAMAPFCVRIDWRRANDRFLVRGVIANDDDATLEFLARFDDLLTKRIRGTLARTSFALATADMIEQIKNKVFAHLMGDDMRPLRAFDPRRGTLANWMSRIGHACAMRRLQELTTPPEQGVSNHPPI
jgi:hypothetical protein